MSARKLKHPHFGTKIPAGRIGDVVNDTNRDRCAVFDVGAAGSCDFDVAVQCWTTREEMARAVRAQEARPMMRGNFRPLVRLKDGEGY